MNSIKLLGLFLVILFNSLVVSNCQEEDIVVVPSDKNLKHYCVNNVYQFQFDIRLSKQLNEIIPFEMIIPLPNRLPFKCIIDGPKSNIYCFHSFQNYVWSLADNSRIELPYSFPEIKGVRWDYDSFLRKIYRYLWRTIGNCGLEYQINPKLSKYNNFADNNQTQAVTTEEKMQIVADVEEISGGECHSSKYDYSFNMNLKLLEGELFEELKKAKAAKQNVTVKFLHEVYVPVLIGDKMQKGKTTFRKDFEYKYATCIYDSELTKDNFEDKVIFVCHLEVNRYVKFQGPLQIKPFTDYAFIEKIDKDKKKTISKIGIKFEILSGFEKPNESSTPTNGSPVTNNNLQGQLTVNEPNFLILNSNLNTFLCPDKPILVVKNYNDGITFGGLNTSGSKYMFLIYGYLTNGYEFVNDTLTLLDTTKEEIKFYLQVTDNLENPDQKKKSVKCHIPTGTSINRNILIEVQCIGTRANLKHNNTDISLNWNLEENNNFENIVVRWPYDLTKKKHIFYYNIKGLSVKKDDFGCFENKFYFYLYVYDLKAEPKISFDLPLVYPKNSYAVCRLYNSVTFKCMLDLRLKKISKGRNIILPSEMTQYLPNREQNIVLYTVNATNFSSILDFQLPIAESCGDVKLVGAIKDIGYSYTQVIIIIVCGFVGIILCFLGVSFCIVYEITHRNRKGPYFKYTEEKALPNTSVSQTQPPAP